MKGARYIASPVIFLFAVITADAAFKAPTFAGQCGLYGLAGVLWVIALTLWERPAA